MVFVDNTIIIMAAIITGAIKGLIAPVSSKELVWHRFLPIAMFISIPSCEKLCEDDNNSYMCIGQPRVWALQ
jgi:hypothetical protein